MRLLKSPIRNLSISALALLNVLIATAVVNAWTHGGILAVAQSIFTTLLVNGGPGGQTIGSTAQDVVRMQCLLNNSTVDPAFSNSFCMSIEPTYGMADYVFNGTTQAKTTMTGLSIYSGGIGAAQRTNFDNENTCHGMGDCWGGVYKVTFGGADSNNGDEGQGFWSDSNINQQNRTDLATILNVQRTTCSTTTTQAITGAQTAQSVSVGTITGTCAVNDWIIVEQQLPGGSDNKEAVQITATSAGHISGVFRNNHLTGVTITPAMVLTLNLSAGLPGQQRVMVNLSSTPNTTGTVSSISGGTFTGTGTSWTNGMVGGTATNIGCISLDADSYNDSNNNFKSGTLRSWYQIVGVTNTTSLGIFSFSAIGGSGYEGQGPITPPEVGSIMNPASTFQIKPCVELLWVASNGTVVVTETTSTTWAIGNNVETVISPYPSMYGMKWDFQKITPGGHIFAGLQMVNASNTSMDIGINLDPSAYMFKAANTAGMVDWHSFVAFTTGFACGNCAVGLQVNAATDEAIRLTGGGNGTLFTGSISGNTLTVSSVQQGSLAVGLQVVSSLNATGTAVQPRTFIIAGSGTTWTIGGPPQTVPSQLMQAGQSNDHAGRIDWNGNYISPNSEHLGMTWYGIVSGNGGRLDMISNNSSTIGGGSLSGLSWQGMFKTVATTMSNTPTCTSSIEGYQVAVTDAAGTLGYGNPISGGGGANHVLAYCNGTNWTFH